MHTFSIIDKLFLFTFNLLVPRQKCLRCKNAAAAHYLRCRKRDHVAAVE